MSTGAQWKLTQPSAVDLRNHYIMLRNIGSSGDFCCRGLHCPSGNAQGPVHDGPIASFPAQRRSHFADTSELPASAEPPANTVAVQMQGAHIAATNAPMLVSAVSSAPPANPQAGFTKTFYKRHLPSPPAIAFSSHEGVGSCHGRYCITICCSRQFQHPRSGISDTIVFDGSAQVSSSLQRRYWEAPWKGSSSS